MSTVAELKDMWREQNWERKANGIPPITWATFQHQARVWRKLKEGK